MTNTAAPPPNQTLNSTDSAALTTLPIASHAATLGYATAALRPHRLSLIVVVVLQIAAAGCAAIAPWQVGRLVDHVASGQLDPRAGVQAALVVAAAAVACAICTALSAMRASTVAELTVAQCRADFVNHALRVPLSIVERVGTGAITSRTSRDMDSLTRCVRDALPKVLVIAVTLLVLFLAALVTGGWAGLVVLVIVPILVAFSRWYLPKSRAAYLRESAAYDTLNTQTAETLNSMKTVDALELQLARNRLMDDTLRWTWCTERYLVALQRLLVAVAEWAPLVALSCAIGCGTALVTADLASIGQVTTVALYVLAMATPINELMQWFKQLQLGGVALSRLVGITSIADDRVSGDALPANNVVSLTDVSFGYTSDRPVLHDVSLTIPAGQRVTIVGPSGSGKSTLGRLIGGVNPPTTGAVCLGGVPIVELPADELHQRICLLTQEYHVFSATIADNLRLATPEATDDDLWAALQTVGSTDAVAALPDGLATMVGSGHLGLDPALAQQLALARIILADPDVIILDEATSLLDPRAARTMEHALNQVLAGRTVIAIAHRLHTAHDADRILVMNDGHVIEDGAHDELLAANGDYAALWHTWQTGNS